MNFKIVTDFVYAELIKDNIKPIIDNLKYLIKNKIIFTVDLTENYHFLNPWMYDNCNAFIKQDPNNYETNEQSNPLAKALAPVNNTQYQLFLENKTPILMILSMKESATDCRDYRINLTACTLNMHEHKYNLKTFLKRMFTESKIMNNHMKDGCFYTFGMNMPSKERKLPIQRTFDNVFIPKYEADNIKNLIDNYKNKREWYIKNNFINHFGFLLYGEPGTGKSSLAQAIANYVGGSIYYTTDINNLPEIYSHWTFNQNINNDEYRTIIIEDIDISLLNNEETKNNKKIKDRYEVEPRHYQYVTRDSSINLATLLNMLDGITAPYNTVYIFTTNRIEKLDPALIRPGRIDHTIEVKNVNIETLNQFTKKFYNRTLPDNFSIKEGLTFGELQILTMVETPFEDFIKHVSK